LRCNTRNSQKQYAIHISKINLQQAREIDPTNNSNLLLNLKVAQLSDAIAQAIILILSQRDSDSESLGVEILRALEEIEQNYYFERNNYTNLDEISRLGVFLSVSDESLEFTIDNSVITDLKFAVELVSALSATNKILKDSYTYKEPQPKSNRDQLASIPPYSIEWSPATKEIIVPNQNVAIKFKKKPLVQVNRGAKQLYILGKLLEISKSSSMKLLCCEIPKLNIIWTVKNIRGEQLLFDKKNGHIKAGKPYDINKDYLILVDLDGNILERHPYSQSEIISKAKDALKKGNLDTAQKYFMQALDYINYATIKADVYRGLGDVAALKNENDAALAYYQQALALIPGLGLKRKMAALEKKINETS